MHWLVGTSTDSERIDGGSNPPIPATPTKGVTMRKLIDYLFRWNRKPIVSDYMVVIQVGRVNTLTDKR